MFNLLIGNYRSKNFFSFPLYEKENINCEVFNVKTQISMQDRRFSSETPIDGQKNLFVVVKSYSTIFNTTHVVEEKKIDVIRNFL